MHGIRNRIGNYLYADGALRRREVNGTTYLIGIAGAYDAFGLIGPEHNGIFILDDTHKRVVLDRDNEETSGYHGPSQRQWAALKAWMEMSEREFRDQLFTHPRSRLADAGRRID